MKDKKTFAKSFKDLREQRAWTQEELATASGVDVRTIQRVEAGASCSLETRKALASAFERDVAEIPSDMVFTGIPKAQPLRLPPMPLLRSGEEVLGVAKPAELFATSVDQNASLDQRKAADEFLDLVRDYGEVWNELTLSMQSDAMRECSLAMTQLTAIGLLVFGRNIDHIIDVADSPTKIVVSAFTVLCAHNPNIIRAESVESFFKDTVLNSEETVH